MGKWYISKEAGVQMKGNPPEELTETRKGRFWHLVAVEDNSDC